MMFTLRSSVQQAFSLAELLVVLAVIGFVAMLVTPKVTVAFDRHTRTAIVKDLTMSVAQAYGVLSVKEGMTAATTFGDIARYMNIANMKTTGSIDSYPGGPAVSCSGSYSCYQMASGSIIAVDNAHTFSEEIPNASLRFIIDTDGDMQAGTTMTNGGTIEDVSGAGAGFFLSYDGRITPVFRPVPNNRMNGVTVAACSDCTPRWLRWMQ